MDSSTQISKAKFSSTFQIDKHQDYTLKLINIEKSSLDTIRTLHQTIKTLRTALYKSKSELSLLKVQVHDEKSYANTIEILALENHILKNKFTTTQFGKDVEEKLISEIMSNKDDKTGSNELDKKDEKETVEGIEERVEESNENTETDVSLESNELETNSKDTTFNDVSEEQVSQENKKQEEVPNMTTASQTNLHEDNLIKEEDEDTESIKESERDQSDSLTLENNENRNLESEESEDVDEVEFIFTTDDTVKLDQDHLVKIEETDTYPPVKPTITHSVFVETDISKCGVLEEDPNSTSKSNLASNIRRNTSPNPLGYRPYLHREGSNRLFGHRHSVKFAKELANVRPIYNENVLSERQDGETQTEISAIPVYWKSESYLNHSKISQNFTTLPSKFSIPNEQSSKKSPGRKYSLRLCEKTQEARRVLLSDINFTSMVPELSRSVDQLCQEVPTSSSELFKNYPGAFSYMKNPDMSCYSQTPCDCSSRQTSWEYSNFSIPSTPSAIDITEPKKRPLTVRPSYSSLDTNWTKHQKHGWASSSTISPALYRRSKSVPFNSNLQPFSEFCSSQYSGLNTPQSASRYFHKHKRMHRKHVAFSGLYLIPIQQIFMLNDRLMVTCKCKDLDYVPTCYK